MKATAPASTAWGEIEAAAGSSGQPSPTPSSPLLVPSSTPTGKANHPAGLSPQHPTWTLGFELSSVVCKTMVRVLKAESNSRGCRTLYFRDIESAHGQAGCKPPFPSPKPLFLSNTRCFTKAPGRWGGRSGVLEELSVQDKRPLPRSEGRRSFQQRSASHPAGLPGQEVWLMPRERWI